MCAQPMIVMDFCKCKSDLLYYRDVYELHLCASHSYKEKAGYCPMFCMQGTGK